MNDCAANLYNYISNTRPVCPLGSYTEIIRESCGIESADRAMITVVKTTGTKRIRFPEGLVPELYEKLALWCSDDEKGLLAKGVIENLVRPTDRDWREFQRLFSRERGETLEEFLPGVVERHGFQKIASLVEKAIDGHRAFRPSEPCSPRLASGVLTPTWDSISYTLSFGDQGKWTFTSRANRQIAIIEALHANGWNPVASIPTWESPQKKQRRLSSSSSTRNLHTYQIKDAIHHPRKRTTGVISWHERDAYGATWKPLV